ncbi:MAG: ubiquitin-conjugating enzyme E2, partial [Desulfobulbus sp.]|nr:ubiquitin-conjugating enzyme E2 [Desulfobulbus sp.]
MTTGSRQVTEDYEQLKKILELYPNISIVKTEGQPPDSYEIEYRLRGYIKEDDITIGIGQTHRVRLTLPFGYPHFPPTAKPLTPVFHPDFDPAAIRLANYWQQNPSLPELVLHIGEMICGIVYDLADPFNQEAAEWYKNQQAQLPLDALNIVDIETLDSPLDLDIPTEGDLPPLGLERDTLAVSQPSAGSADIQYIRNLIEESKIVTANRLLAELPGDTPVAEREEIQLHIGKVLRKVDQLFKLAEQLESMSKLAEAMEVVNNIKTLAADAPGADALSKKIQQALRAATSAAASSKPGKAEAKSATSASSPTRPARPTSKPLPRPEPLSFKPIIASILVLAVAALCVFLYLKDQDTLSQSQASLLQGQQLIEKKQFDQALATLEGAKAILSDLTILHFRKSTQEQAINSLISSTDLQEGLGGRVAHQGEYIPATSVPFLGELDALTNHAQALAEQNKIAEALVLYRQALKFATDLSLGNQQAS